MNTGKREITIKEDKPEMDPFDTAKFMQEWKIKHSSPGKFKIKMNTNDTSQNFWWCERNYNTVPGGKKIMAECTEDKAMEFGATSTGDGIITLMYGQNPVVYFDKVEYEKLGFFGMLASLDPDPESDGSLIVERKCAIDRKEGLSECGFSWGANRWEIKPDTPKPATCNIL